MASLSRTYDTRKLLGQVYTPPHIVDKILDEVGFTSTDFLGKSVLDPACGDGRFLREVIRRIIRYSPKGTLAENLQKVQGWDIDAEALALCRATLNQEIEPLGLKIAWELQERDALHQLNATQRFDFIVGNPPYIRIQHLPETQRQYLQDNYRFCSSGSTDTYVAFFELANRLLKKTGVCGFITPNSYFFSETARPLRCYFQQEQNLRLITNFGSVRVFEKTGTYAAITVFGKNHQENFRYELSDANFGYTSRLISFQELNGYDLWQLSVKKPTPDKGTRLADICRISVGITTLSDKIYLFTIQDDNSGNHVWGTSGLGQKVKLERTILKPIVKASRLKAGHEPITEYVLFPYRKNEAGKHSIIPEAVLRMEYPFAYAYLQAQKPALDRRDNGKPNAVAWYAFGRAQSLDSSFGKKIIFSPMNRLPNFILHENPEATLYSGYFIKYEGDYHKLLPLLNSQDMAEYMAVAGRDFRGGWKGYSKKIVENFRLDIAALKD
ncbi:HsdM family class I SAM-dependent methyltransferase [Salmonirosea aquatica]|uniref:site-specific DNA-methyltransferase (adenine-specific) n=1 Tax=Salmonirosea aquatica TaxID=2654236 RepID=A0A7C9FB75_9BACT|nr:N-6 DNA methylase [Cytophagaceae bacterium SJW1-29]